MYSLKLWHFLVTASLIVALISMAIHHLFIKDSTWQALSATGLEHKVNVGLEQIYWQWQSEGRPQQIIYQPAHSNKAITIPIRDDGTPAVEVSSENCRAFLNWFVDGVSVDEWVNVSAHTYSEQSPDGFQQDSVEACRYRLSNSSFAYHASTAEILP